MEKTLVMGLDACSWPIIEEARTQDAIPTISRHIDEGYAAALESTIPAKTVPAWKTLMTGKNPARLGVFDGRIGAWGGEKRVPLQYDFPTADFWDYLNEYFDASTAIINGTNTTPPRALDGVMVSRRFVDDAKIEVYPASERERLADLGYQTYRSFRDLIAGTPDPDLTEVKAYLDTHYRVANEYLHEHDVVMLTTMVTDQFEHEYLDGQPVIDLYSYIDGLLADIEDDHPELNVVIVSDHGMTEGPDEVIWINQWLKERGYLVEAGAETGSKETIRNGLLAVWDRLPGPLQTVAKRVLSTTGVEESVSEFTRDFDVDWERSTAVYWVGGIRTNTDDDGIEDELREAFEADFGHLYPDELEPLLDTEEIFEGEYLDEAPALTINPYLERHVRFRQNANADVVTDDSETRWNHEHDPVGVFVADGPLFDSVAERREARIYDVLPTLIGAYGVEVDAELDGQILANALATEPTRTVPKLPPPSPEDYLGEVEDVDAFTADVEDHLKSLGYLE